MDIGTVFIWNSYPFNKEKDSKDRWFVYLGEYNPSPDPFDQTFNILIVMPTTTTKLEYYELSGYRENHLYIRFSPDEGFGFSKPCVLDLTYFSDDVKKHVFEKYLSRGEILIKGRISTSRLREIYQKIFTSTGYPRILKCQICNNLRSAGIDGLPMPPKSKRKQQH